MKKLVAVLLALLLIVPSFAAFAEEEDRYGRYETPIHLSILSEDFKTGTTAYDSSDPTRRSATENAWITAYKDYLNIEVERIIAEDGTALNAQVNTGMASGELPDGVIVGKEMFYKMIENEVCADMTEAWNGYAQKNYLEQAVGNVLDTATSEGKLLGIPIIGNCYNNAQLLWVRQDWLKKVGKEIPKTLDEMIDVARAFKAAKLGGEETVGMGMSMGDSYQGSYNSPAAICAAYGSVWGAWQPAEDGGVVWGKVTEGNKQGLLKVQEMYKEGLLKSDFASSNTTTEDVANGKIGMYYATGWHSVTDIKTSLVNDPEADWMYVAAPSLDGQPVKQWNNCSVAAFLVVNPECEHPEAFLKMMELELKVFIDPSDEELPKLYAGTDDFLYWDLRVFRNLNLSNFDLYRSALVNEHLEKNTPVEEVPASIKDYYNQCVRALNGERALYGRYLCQKYAFPIYAENLEKGLYLYSYNGPLTETMTTYEKTLNSELDAAMVKVMMGEDIAVYEKAVEDWYKNGGQTITDEVNAYYAAQK